MPKRNGPTMADVARLCGVTAMTVSRALSGNGFVSEETRAKIVAAADKLGYIFDSTAAVFASGKSGFVAVIIASLNNSNFAEIVHGITQGLAGTRLQVLLGYTDYDFEQEERVVRSMLTRRPEAIVITEGLHTQRSRRLLRSTGIPAIELGGAPIDPMERIIGFSNREAGARMTEYLIARGYDKIAFVGGDTKRDTRGLERLTGYKRAMKKAGRDIRTVNHEPPIAIRHGEELLHKLLATWPDTQAAVCVSDLLAFGMLASCQRRGIKVPKDLAITGFSNYDVAQYCVPGITTVDFFPREMGLTIAEKVKNLLGEGEGRRSAPIHSPRFRIVERESA
jgi:LacI family gluconate utilization system Gnt-I transcriptional repressor